MLPSVFGESWPPSCFFDPHGWASACFPGWPPTPPTPKLLSASCVPQAEWFCLGERLCSFRWLLSEVRLAPAIAFEEFSGVFLFQAPLTLATLFSSTLWSSRDSSCDRGAVLGCPAAFLVAALTCFSS